MNEFGTGGNLFLDFRQGLMWCFSSQPCSHFGVRCIFRDVAAKHKINLDADPVIPHCKKQGRIAVFDTCVTFNCRN